MVKRMSMGDFCQFQLDFWKITIKVSVTVSKFKYSYIILDLVGCGFQKTKYHNFLIDIHNIL